jgi:peptidoglycan/LPS O-acetylase OafA/YrhL
MTAMIKPLPSYLDLLRMIATLAVVIYHIVQAHLFNRRKSPATRHDRQKRGPR